MKPSVKKNRYIDLFESFFALDIEKTFLLASLPFIGYLSAYFYQLAFYNYFDVPNIFIKIGVETIIYSSIYSLAILILVSLFIFLIGGIKGNTHSKNEIYQTSKRMSYIESLILVSLLDVVIIIILYLNFNFLLTFKFISSCALVTFTLIPAILFPKFRYPSKSFSKSINIFNLKVNEYNEKLLKQINKKGLRKTSFNSIPK